MEYNKDEHSLFIEINNGYVFKSLINSMNIILEECYFKFTKEGIEIRSSDIMLKNDVHCKLPYTSFTKYHISSTIKIGLVLGLVTKCLKDVKKSDVLYMIIDKEDKKMVQFVIYESIHSKNTMNIKMIDIDCNVKTDDDNYQYRISMQSKEFQSICKSIANINGDVVKITCIKNIITFETHDSTIKSVITRIGSLGDKNDEETNDSKIKFIQYTNVPHQGVFPIKSLNSLSNSATALSTYVSVLIQNDKPLMLEYNCTDLGTIRFRLDLDNRMENRIMM